MIITIQVTDTQQQTITVHYSHGALQSSVSVPVLCLMSGMIMLVVLMPREVRTHWHQPGGTHRHWTQPPQSQNYTHTIITDLKGTSVYEIFSIIIFFIFIQHLQGLSLQNFNLLLSSHFWLQWELKKSYMSVCRQLVLIAHLSDFKLISSVLKEDLCVLCLDVSGSVACVKDERRYLLSCLSLVNKFFNKQCFLKVLLKHYIQINTVKA